MSGPTLAVSIAVAAIVGLAAARGAAGQCEVAQLSAGSGSVGDDFGRSVAIGGNVAVVGDTRFPDSGVAFAFRRDGDVWTPEAELRPPVLQPEDSFGHSVAVSGDIVLVGSPGANALGFNSGAAHVFRYRADSSRWAHETTLTASDGDGGDRFGWSVSLCGDLALIGARDDENDGVAQSGSAYVFRNADGVWVEEARLCDPNGEELDLFGVSVAIDGRLALIGALGNDDAGSGAGAAFVFRHIGQQWVLETQLTASDAIGDERFGFSVSLADGIAVIGSVLNDGLGNDSGAAYVFRSIGFEWSQEAKLLASDGGPLRWFGWAASISPDASTVLVSAIRDNELGFEAGAAYVFRHVNHEWTETAKLTASDGGPNQGFGIAVSLGDDIALIGAPVPSENPGHAYVFLGTSGIDCNLNSVPDACDIFEGTAPDGNANGIPDECEAGGDFNGDGAVNVLDFLMLLALWGPCPEPCPPSCSGDADGDCAVDVGDLLIVLKDWT